MEQESPEATHEHGAARGRGQGFPVCMVEFQRPEGPSSLPQLTAGGFLYS
jgi:hypothetical protein